MSILLVPPPERCAQSQRSPLRRTALSTRRAPLPSARTKRTDHLPPVADQIFPFTLRLERKTRQVADVSTFRGSRLESGYRNVYDMLARCVYHRVLIRSASSLLSIFADRSNSLSIELTADRCSLSIVIAVIDRVQAVDDVLAGLRTPHEFRQP